MVVLKSTMLEKGSMIIPYSTLSNDELKTADSNGSKVVCRRRLMRELRLRSLAVSVSVAARSLDFSHRTQDKILPYSSVDDNIVDTGYCPFVLQNTTSRNTSE